jgi:hypothetical protein
VAVIAALTILTAGLWWLFLYTVEGNVESAWMYLPLPAITLVTWWWTRWWAVREVPLILHEDEDRLMEI